MFVHHSSFLFYFFILSLLSPGIPSYKVDNINLLAHGPSRLKCVLHFLRLYLAGIFFLGLVILMWMLPISKGEAWGIFMFPHLVLLIFANLPYIKS